jgi:photosystem II stability/assembly factor-like uncharacterized protein
MVDHLMYLGTDDGIVVVRRLPGDWGVLGAGLKGLQISALAHRPGQPREVLAGTYGRGMFHSSDAGQNWQPVNCGLAHGHLRSILWDPEDPGVVLAGTEPVAIYRSRDGGQTWSELPAIRSIPGHERWYLPYSPRAGAVRCIVGVPGLAGTYYAGVEQGGVLYSDDGGESWVLLNSTLHPDIHQVVVAADGGSILLTATGGGVFQSIDGGRRWEQVTPDYTRALVQQPGHPYIIVAGPAARVGHLGRVERSYDGGSNWEQWSHGLLVPLPGMVEQLVANPGGLDDLGGIFAVLSSGEIYHSDFNRADWTLIVQGMPPIRVIDVGVGRQRRDGRSLPGTRHLTPDI